MPLCFAIMPITTPEEAVARYNGDSDHFIHVAEFIFKPAAELAGYRFVPAAVDSSRVIQAAIIRNLADADVVLCDTSLWNANVFFELGIRVALNRPVALVRDKLTAAIPFDNTPVHCYEYDHRMEPWCLKAEVPKLADHITAAGKHDQNELWKFAGIQVTAQQTRPGNPEDAKLDILMADVGQLRQAVETIRAQETTSPDVPHRSIDHQAHFPGRGWDTDEAGVSEEMRKVLVNAISQPDGKLVSRFVPMPDGEDVAYLLDGPVSHSIRNHLIRKTKDSYPKAKRLHIFKADSGRVFEVLDLATEETET